MISIKHTQQKRRNHARITQKNMDSYINMDYGSTFIKLHYKFFITIKCPK